MSNSENYKKKFYKRGPARDGQLQPGVEVLQKLFESGGDALSEQFLRWKLWRQWTQVVGSKIGVVTEPVSYQRGRLSIWVKSSAWMQQLIFGLEPMKNQINQFLGFEYVKELHLTLDRRSVPDSPEERQKLKESFEQLLGDEDL